MSGSIIYPIFAAADVTPLLFPTDLRATLSAPKLLPSVFQIRTGTKPCSPDLVKPRFCLRISCEHSVEALTQTCTLITPLDYLK